jgi:hypothetical protein
MCIWTSQLSWKTQIPSTSVDVSSLEFCKEGRLPDDHDRMSLTFSKDLPYRFKAQTVVWIFLFSYSRRNAHCGQVPSVLLVQLRVLQFFWDITSKYRSLLLLFFALNSRITPSNNAVGKGMKKWCNDNWICCNTVTVFFRTRFHSAIQTAVMALLKGTEGFRNGEGDWCL